MNTTTLSATVATHRFDRESAAALAAERGLELAQALNGDQSPTSIWQIFLEQPSESNSIVAVEIDTETGASWTVYADAEKDGVFTAAQARSHAERLIEASTIADELNSEVK